MMLMVMATGQLVHCPPNKQNHKVILPFCYYHIIIRALFVSYLLPDACAYLSQISGIDGVGLWIVLGNFGEDRGKALPVRLAFFVFFSSLGRGAKF